MSVLRQGSKCTRTAYMIRFFTFRAPDSRDFAKLNLLVLNPNLIIKKGYSYPKFEDITF